MPQRESLSVLDSQRFSQAPESSRPAASSRVSFDRYSLKVDGKRLMVRSAAFHYFRLPDPSLWRDRLLKLKAAGYNTVDLYFNWGYHSPYPGFYEFNGAKDIHYLLNLTQELGLWVVARPGPYINAELSLGGFPHWLLQVPDLDFRSLREGKHHHSSAYFARVEQWWQALFPYLKNRPNLLMLQIENEYSNETLDPAYLQGLYQLARRLGITVPLSHNDLYGFGCFEQDVDLYLIDHYPTFRPQDNWKEAPEQLLQSFEGMEERLREYCPQRPLGIQELQSGWFSGWEGASARRVRELLGQDHLRLVTKAALAEGITLWNHYMGVGGTNFGHQGSPESRTSYDFAAPIQEGGALTAPYYEAKALNLFLESFGLEATVPVSCQELPPIASQWPQGELVGLHKVRRVVEGPYAGTFWFVFRNLLSHAVIAFHSQGQQLVLPAYDLTWIPANLPLGHGYTLVWCGSEVLAYQEGFLMVKGDRTFSIRVEGPQGQHWELTFPPLSPTEWAEQPFGPLKLMRLGEKLLTRIWQHPTEGYVLKGIQQDWRLTSQSTAPLPTLRRLLEPEQDASLRAPQSAEPQAWGFMPVLPEALHWVAATCKALPNQAALDMDTLRLYEGACIYQLVLPEGKVSGNGEEHGALVPSQLSLSFRHHVWVWLNDRYLGCSSAPLNASGSEGAGTLEIPIPAEAWYPDKRNRFLMMVDYLGHPKGFHHNFREAGGILEVALWAEPLDLTENPSERSLALATEGAFSEDTAQQIAPLPPQPSPRKLSGIWKAFTGHYRQVTARLDQSPLALACNDHTHWHGFTQFLCAKADAPMGFWLILPDSWLQQHQESRINLLLNGHLIGRLWSGKGKEAQSRFFVPPIFLASSMVQQLDLEIASLEGAFNKHELFEQLAAKLVIEYISSDSPLPEVWQFDLYDSDSQVHSR
jgi:Glycosyl hydrolases family 35